MYMYAHIHTRACNYTRIYMYISVYIYLCIRKVCMSRDLDSHKYNFEAYCTREVDDTRAI